MEQKHDAVRVIARLSRVFETRLGDEGMTLSQFRLLAFLSEGEWAASVLADWLAVSRPSITSLVDGLVEKGWVTREHSPEDRRRVLHHLTVAGRDRVREASGSLEDVLGSLLDHLDREDQQRALEGLDLLHEAMRRHKEAVVSS